MSTPEPQWNWMRPLSTRGPQESDAAPSPSPHPDDDDDELSEADAAPALSSLDIALTLAATGLPVFPCTSQKRPCIAKAKGGNGFQDASTDPDRIRELWGLAGPAAQLVGTPTGAASGFDVLDADPRHGSDDWRTANIPRLPETRIHGTMNGGEHWLFRHVDGVRNGASKIAPGVDVRGAGGYIIMPPSAGYAVIHEADIAPWPDWLLPLVIKVAEPAPRPDPNSYATPPTVTDARLRGFIDREVRRVRDAPVGGRHGARLAAARSIGGVAVEAGLSDTAAEQMLIAARPPEVEEEKERRTIRDGLALGRTEPIDLNTLPDSAQFRGYQQHRGNGASRDGHAEQQDDSDTGPDGETAEAKAGTEEQQFPPIPTPPPSDEPGRKKRSLNALLLVRRINNATEWQDAIRLNELTADIEVRNPFPPNGNPDGTFRPLRDPIDALEAMLWFQANGIPKASKGLIYDAITIVAHRHAYHPVRQYLDALRWDGTQRVGTLFQHYFKAELPDDPTERDRMVAYLEHISRCFLVSAVARIYQPGCKADHMPVPIGPQGSNKSKAIRALCKDGAWFTDDLSPDLIERDTKDSLNGKWIIELAEMPHVRKEIERVKAFISRPTDRFRRAYDRLTNDWPRQCVFIGSSNDLEFIDPTGNRRFWPFWISGPIDVDAIICDRDQLWAEAVALYLEGTPWWLPPKLELIAADQQSGFVETDIWDNLLEEWIKKNTASAPFDLPTIMAGALDYPDARRIPKQDQMRAAACLKRLGYRRGDPKRTVAGRRRFWSPR